MELREDKLDAAITRLDEQLAALSQESLGATAPTVLRWRSDAAALLFHLRREAGALPLICVLGGTGTGKSTIVNRLLGATVSATSFRRTFTSGAVAATAKLANIPSSWLNIEHEAASPDDQPARGRPGVLIIAINDAALLASRTIVDTPDLDGDQPAHHAEADRAFRWADAVIVLVTPEKYQMTEMLPYYRLAERYAIPALFLMNKCEQQPVLDDYAKLLKQQRPLSSNRLFVVARDDAAYEPPVEQNLDALRQTATALEPVTGDARQTGLSNRAGDLLGRAEDQILSPLRRARAEIDNLIATLRASETPVPGVDVNPVTLQLQRRMRQRSVLYLMGPQRVLDRVRQAPGLLVRLPRVAWDYVMRGEISAASLNPNSDAADREAPDFKRLLIDQFNIVQSRLDDALRQSRELRRDGAEAPYKSAMIDPEQAGRIAEEELGELRNWLEKRWNATPRDTRLLESLLRHLPGGKKITQWTEAAPYLLVLVVAAATHHLFGGVDLAVLGGWSVATWLSERLSNEVSAHTRATNQKITDRFAHLAHEQIEKLCRWLDEQAPSTRSLDEIAKSMDTAQATLQ
jgi:hypothetical protein